MCVAAEYLTASVWFIGIEKHPFGQPTSVFHRVMYATIFVITILLMVFLQHIWNNQERRSKH